MFNSDINVQFQTNAQSVPLFRANCTLPYDVSTFLTICPVTTRLIFRSINVDTKAYTKGFPFAVNFLDIILPAIVASEETDMQNACKLCRFRRTEKTK